MCGKLPAISQAEHMKRPVVIATGIRPENCPASFHSPIFEIQIYYLCPAKKYG